MADLTNTQTLNQLIINKVDSQATFEDMLSNNLVNDNELYLIEDNEATSARVVLNPVLTASSGVWTWQIAAAGNSTSSNLLVSIYDISTGTQVYPDVSINQSSGVITVLINDTNSETTLTASTYKAVIIG